jgi:hypothetical protein
MAKRFIQDDFCEQGNEHYFLMQGTEILYQSSESKFLKNGFTPCSQSFG